MTGTVFYTAIFGGRDLFRAPPELPYDFKIFTDDCELAEKEPRAIYTPLLIPRDPIRSARLVKAMPHVFLPGYGIWVWYDSALAIKPDASLAGMIERAGRFGVFQHPERNCVYGEAQACIDLGRDDADVIVTQMQKYLEVYKHPADDGLASTCVLVRRNLPELVRFNAMWWREIALHSRRDQLSFNVIARRLKLPVVYLGNRRENPWFVQVGHQR